MSFDLPELREALQRTLNQEDETFAAEVLHAIRDTLLDQGHYYGSPEAMEEAATAHAEEILTAIASKMTPTKELS